MKKEKTIWIWIDTLIIIISVLGCAYFLYISFYYSWYYLPLVLPWLLLFCIGDIGIEKIWKCWKDAEAKDKKSKSK